MEARTLFDHLAEVRYVFRNAIGSMLNILQSAPALIAPRRALAVAAVLSVALMPVTPALAAGQTAGSGPEVAAPNAVTNTGRFTSALIDSAGRERISYYDQGSGDLKYAIFYYQDPGGNCGPANTWSCDTIDNGAGANVGQYTSLTVAPALIFISYFDVTNGDLKLAALGFGLPACPGAPAGWGCVTVDHGGGANAVVGQYTSVKLDISGRPHVSYYDATNGNLKYARFTGVPADNCGPGGAPGWLCSTVDTGGAGIVGLFTSIEVFQKCDTVPVPQISYYDATNGDLKYAALNHPFGFPVVPCPGGAAGWGCTTVDSAGVVGQYTSLEMNYLGWPRISYFDATNGDLKFTQARYTANAGNCGVDNWWACLTVDSGGADNVGQFSSMAMGSRGLDTPHFSYYDATNRALKYAVLIHGPAMVGNCGTNNIFFCQNVEAGGGGGPLVGQYTSIMLHPEADTPRISYFRYDPITLEGDLKFTRPFAAGWAWLPETIDP
jgi:hypothetical protein